MKCEVCEKETNETWRCDQCGKEVCAECLAWCGSDNTESWCFACKVWPTKFPFEEGTVLKKIHDQEKS